MTENKRSEVGRATGPVLLDVRFQQEPDGYWVALVPRLTDETVTAASREQAIKAACHAVSVGEHNEQPDIPRTLMERVAALENIVWPLQVEVCEVDDCIVRMENDLENIRERFGILVRVVDAAAVEFSLIAQAPR